jgi:hypothetical protein
MLKAPVKALVIVLWFFAALVVLSADRHHRLTNVKNCKAEGTAEWQCRAMSDSGRHR